MDSNELMKVVEAVSNSKGEWIQWASTPEDFQLIVFIYTNYGLYRMRANGKEKDGLKGSLLKSIRRAY